MVDEEPRMTHNVQNVWKASKTDSMRVELMCLALEYKVVVICCIEHKGNQATKSVTEETGCTQYENHLTGWRKDQHLYGCHQLISNVIHETQKSIEKCGPSNTRSASVIYSCLLMSIW